MCDHVWENTGQSWSHRLYLNNNADDYHIIVRKSCLKQAYICLFVLNSFLSIFTCKLNILLDDLHVNRIVSF